MSERLTPVGVSALRVMNASELRKLKEPLLITSGCVKLAVLVPYKQYMEIQTALIKAMKDARDFAELFCEADRVATSGGYIDAG